MEEVLNNQAMAPVGHMGNVHTGPNPNHEQMIYNIHRIPKS